MCVSEGMHVEVRGQYLGVGSLLPLWDVGIKLKSSGLCNKSVTR